jgi:hypothetical protein
VLISIVLPTNTSADEQGYPEKKVLVEYSAGFSRYILDPDAELSLYGLTAEARILFDREAHAVTSGGMSTFRVITLGSTKALGGEIDAWAIGVAYGPRFDFSRMYFGFGVGPFTYVLLSNNKTYEASGYSLDTGPRLHVYFDAGYKYRSGRGTILTACARLNFTVRHVSWHNPFAPHKHEDMFSYLTLQFGIIR